METGTCIKQVVVVVVVVKTFLSLPDAFQTYVVQYSRSYCNKQEAETKLYPVEGKVIPCIVS